MREYILHHMPTEFRSTESEHTDVLTEEVAHYLTMADEIAKQVYLCSAGDDYRPGYYSEISIDDYGIRLKQINYHNARSIKHKQDYYMRTLEFYIPLTTEEPKLLFQQEKIGKMLVEFSDSSSEHNKVCGNKILEKLKEARLKFEV